MILSSKPYPAQLDEWLGLAQQQNLKIQQARLQKRYAEDQRRVEKLHFIHR